MLPKVHTDRDEVTQEVGRLPSLASVGQDLRGSDPLYTVEEWLDMNQQVLRNLSLQSRMFESLFEDLDCQIRRVTESQESPRRPVLPAAPRSVVSAPDTQDLALALVSFPSIPLYARRLFTVRFKLVNRSGEIQPRDEKIVCRLSVHKMTDIGQEIKRTREGTPLIKGSLVKTFQPDQDLILQTLMFKDISGLFPQGRVNLLIRATSNPSIKPLFIEGVRVKARKKHPDEVY